MRLRCRAGPPRASGLSGGGRSGVGAAGSGRRGSPPGRSPSRYTGRQESGPAKGPSGRSGGVCGCAPTPRAWPAPDRPEQPGRLSLASIGQKYAERRNETVMVVICPSVHPSVHPSIHPWPPVTVAPLQELPGRPGTSQTSPL